ncbi:hypothetical protein M758_3G206800 [Ceratodon purpureus]|nr:hypothetical protein M758_3G206800 [Ceratodon purpureus]
MRSRHTPRKRFGPPSLPFPPVNLPHTVSTGHTRNPSDLANSSPSSPAKPPTLLLAHSLALSTSNFSPRSGVSSFLSPLISLLEGEVALFAMRIRKGKRCLPMAPADRSFEKAGKEYALLRLVAVAATGGGGGVSGGRRVECRDDANGASPERLKKYLECDLEKNRVSADDNFNERSLIHDTDIDSALKKLTATSPMAKSVFTRHEPSVTTGTICSSTSAIDVKDQPKLLEQSLRHIVSRAENKSLITGDVSGSHRGETVSSSDMIEAAMQLQSMQKSHSNSLGSGVVELCETPSSHGENHKAAQNTTEDFVGQSKVGPDYTDVTAVNQKSSSSASRSQNVTQTDQNGLQCKRDDGKGWRCHRPAEGGYTMCQYHREQICRSQSRRKRSKFDVEPTVAAISSPSRYVVNTRAVPNAIVTGSDYCPFLDDELAYDERREFVKAKSLKFLLLSTDVRPTVRAKIF